MTLRREIAQLAGDMGRITGKHQNDLLSLEAIRDEFCEVYWRKGERLDAGKVLMDKFKTSPLLGTDFAYRAVAEEFHFIESGMLPVIIVRNGRAKRVVERLRLDPNVCPAWAARELQSFLVQVPSRYRSQLIDNREVEFVKDERFDKQFAELVHRKSYDDRVGLIWEVDGRLSVEDMTCHRSFIQLLIESSAIVCPVGRFFTTCNSQCTAITAFRSS